MKHRVQHGVAQRVVQRVPLLLVQKRFRIVEMVSESDSLEAQGAENGLSHQLRVLSVSQECMAYIVGLHCRLFANSPTTR